MNTDSPSSSPLAGAEKKLNIHICGIGGAGCRIVSRASQDGLAAAAIVALHTDAQSLASQAVAKQIVLGRKVTRGLSTGGDCERGRLAAEEVSGGLSEQFRGADLVFIVAGLGGGTGTGAAPVIARAARESGALVLALVTLPYDFEGARRQRQAQYGVERLKAEADAVVCLPNQKLFQIVDENTTLVDAFKISNDLLVQAMRAIQRMLTRRGLMPVDFADLCNVVRGRHAESSFATAEAAGSERAREVVEKLRASPMLDAGRTLADADSVLVSIVAGTDLTLTETGRLMELVNQHCDNAQVVMAASIDEVLGGKLQVTLIASTHSGPAEVEAAPSRSTQPAASAADTLGIESSFIQQPAAPIRPAARHLPAAPELSPEAKEQLIAKQRTVVPRARRKSPGAKQQQFDFEIVSKGRFEKSQPTIHRGEDLDVPTFIRRGIALN